MSEAQHVKHLLETAYKKIEDMEPLKNDKNPIWAAVIGFLFGPIGIGIYFNSVKDFFWCLLFLILLTLIIPGLRFFLDGFSLRRMAFSEQISQIQSTGINLLRLIAFSPLPFQVKVLFLDSLTKT